MLTPGLRTATTVVVAACWGAFVLTWLAGAYYNALRGPGDRTRAQFVSMLVPVYGVTWILHRAVPAEDWAPLIFQVAWARIVGLVVAVVSTAFTLWARLALGTMWSGAPMVKEQHRLRTDGPYAITRHPIYTGILGMSAGTALALGGGVWVFAFPVLLVAIQVKLRIEEGLMLAEFPDDYPDYRRRVPQLVPGLRLPHRATG